MVNSSNSKAVVVSGGAKLTGPTLNINRGDSGSTANITATVTTGVAQVADPLAGIAVPVAANYTVQSTSNLNIGSGTRTLNPGEHTGGIAINGATVTLNPGVYYITGGGFKVNGGSSSVTGSGVMIYNVPAASGDVITVAVGEPLNPCPPRRVAPTPESPCSRGPRVIPTQTRRSRGEQRQDHRHVVLPHEQSDRVRLERRGRSRLAVHQC